MKIRRAKAEDFDEIKRLLNMLYKHELQFDRQFLDILWPESTEGQKYIKKMISSARFCTMVADGDSGRLLGFATFCFKKSEPDRKNMKVVELDCLYVEHESRMQGLATNLISALSSWAKKHGSTRLVVGASFDNTIGRKFYESIGFKNQSIYLEKNL